MANKCGLMLTKLCILTSVLSVALSAPVTIPHASITSHHGITSTCSRFLSHKFHRPAFSKRSRAAGVLKRGSGWGVHAGDTGNKIAAQLGIQFSQLAYLNPNVQWKLLQMISTLNVPGNAKNGDHTYTVAAGDTGSSIALSIGVSLDLLVAYNQDLDWNNLFVSQVLRIPAPGTDSSQVPSSIETDANTTAKYSNTPASSFTRIDTGIASGTKSISPFLTPGETSSPSSSFSAHVSKARHQLKMRGNTRQASGSIFAGAIYTVRPGDTGNSIAAQLGITFDILSELNPGLNWSNLQIGQKLNIPGSALSPITTMLPIPQSSQSSQTSPTSSSPNPSSANHIPTSGAYVTYLGAVTTAQPPYPSMSAWVPFDQMWTINAANIGTTCVFASGSVPPNTASENANLRSAILKVSAATQVDPSFILAVVLQESNGCVRVPTTSSWEGISNPGLMQSFNGRASCNSRGRMQQPCPSYLIKAMIMEGVRGNKNVGIVPALLSAAKQDRTQWSATGNTNVNGKTNMNTSAQMNSGRLPNLGPSSMSAAGESTLSSKSTDEAKLYYQAARIYNTGSLSTNGDLDSATGSTRCYVSDIVNRLVGWTGAGPSCSLS